MADPTIQTLNDIVMSGESESLTLEFKQSNALKRTEGAKNELSKDISAIANSAGGRIIFGIVETSNIPQNLDDGCDDTEIDREWIEQVINSRIQPRIEGLVITPIASATPGHSYYVIDMPQATSRAPHQAHDKRYYKRQNFQVLMMEDYEVKDAMRRATTPELYTKFAFSNGESSVQLRISEDQDYADGVSLTPTIHNAAIQPAAHAIIEIYIHPQIRLSDDTAYRDGVKNVVGDVPRLMRYKSFSIASPPSMPIFKEGPFTLPPICLSVPRAALGGFTPTIYPFAYDLRCPSFSIICWGSLVVDQQRMIVEFPPRY